ncbi:MAG: DUF4190 domain-containing protein [Bacillota bacterium]
MDNTRPVAVQQPNNTLGIVALVCGILGVLLFFCCPYLSVVLGLVALVCGVLANQQHQKYALAGIILGIAALVLGIVFAIIGQFFLTELFEVIQQEMIY